MKPLPSAFSRGLFRTKARPLPCSVGGIETTAHPAETNLAGNLGWVAKERTQLIVGGCLMDATITVTVTLNNTKGV